MNRFHLSTLVTIVLVLSVLIYWNTRGDPIICVDSLGTLQIMRRDAFGWPFKFFHTDEKNRCVCNA